MTVEWISSPAAWTSRPEREDDSIVTIEQQARQAVLDALLSGTPLPGGIQPLLFPDTPRIAEGPVILVDTGDQGLCLPSRVRSVPPGASPDLLHQQPAAPVLEFLEPEPFPNRVGVRLRVSRLEDQVGLVPLGEIVATFVSTAESNLTVTDPTHVVAF